MIITLGSLEVGARFLFAADDLTVRGPATLLYKTNSRATYSLDGASGEVKTFEARDKDGQPVQVTVQGKVEPEHCSLGAEVLPL